MHVPFDRKRTCTEYESQDEIGRRDTGRSKVNGVDVRISSRVGPNLHRPVIQS